MKKSYQVALIGAGFLTLGMTGSALAFHGGGVAHCDGCHTMHNSADNASTNGVTAHLMKGTDASSTCLNCHGGAGGYHVASTDGSNGNQGGDFFWVSEAGSYTYDVRGNVITSSNEQHGHNIVAADFGFTQDTNNTAAPGGTMAASTLGCTSCHDAHGQVAGQTQNTSAISVSGSYGGTPAAGTITGNFRLLGGSGYIPGDHVAMAGDAFPALTPPTAVSENVRGFSYGTFTNYGAGMSAWCAACHPNFYTQAAGGSEMHPTDVTLAGSTDGREYVNIYNTYAATGDQTNSFASAFDALVPIERGATGLAGGAQDASGADAESKVMCLSCHRAHASAFNNMGRWDFETDLLAHSATYASAGSGTYGALAGTELDYYKGGAKIDITTEYGAYQRSLCNKCHGQD